MLSIEYGQKTIYELARNLPETSGVYQMLNSKGDSLYIGKAKNLKKRVMSYVQIEKLPNRLRRMIAQTTSLKIVTTYSEVEALLLENNLIKKQKPYYNILLKDDKSFPYILITNDHPFPRIEKQRGPQKIKGRYFGPLAPASAVKEVLILLQKVFLLRNCRDSFFENRTRPCLQYHIKQCSAPCVGHISPQDYSTFVKQATDYLGGKTDQVQEFLAKKMQEASHSLAFEEAAHYRDRIQLLTRFLTHQRRHVYKIRDADIIGIMERGGETCVQIFFFRNSQNFGNDSFFLTQIEDSQPSERLAAFINQFYTEHEPAPLIILNIEPLEFTLIQQSISQRHNKKIKWEVNPSGQKQELLKNVLANATHALDRHLSQTAILGTLLDQLKDLFSLNTRPSRIEVYDNSHLQGTNPYGVMIVADETGFNKRAYRKFAIRMPSSSFSGDDYAMMREVLYRRLARYRENNWHLPELMLIDGGLGQLNVVLKVLREFEIIGVTVVGMAKGRERNSGHERFFMEGRVPFSLPENTPILHYLQRLRDEAHRFALCAHRIGRHKKVTRSKLDEIPGIGVMRKKRLLHHFGCTREVENASLEELTTVPGINKSLAKLIYEYFHDSSYES